MNIDSLRKFCMAFPSTTEKLQWGETLCFKLAGKIFAMAGLSSVPQSLTLKCDPEIFAEMTERDGVVPAPYVGRYKWIMLERLDAVPVSELKGLIANSYEMVSGKNKASKRKHSRSSKIKKRGRKKRIS